MHLFNSNDNSNNDLSVVNFNTSGMNEADKEEKRLHQFNFNLFDENDKSPSVYIETSLGNFEKQSSLHQCNDNTQKSGYIGRVYVKPKPLLKGKSDLSDELIKIKIDREIDKAQFNTLAKMMNLKDFKRLKPRAPKDLLKRIYNPMSLDRKPFVVEKWTSPYQKYKENQ